VVACTEKGKDLIYDTPMNQPLAIIMGSEEDGISNGLIRKADFLGKIPLKGKISSLNVSVASALVIFEAVRQRG
jgi:23S rRNA (guanosine2251-2'-O)-methyltransferase